MTKESLNSKISTIDSFAVNNLKTLRKEHKLTLEKLAELTNLSTSYLSRLEVGNRRFNTDILQKLSYILKCHPSDIIDPKSTPATVKKDLPIYGKRPGEENVDFSSPLDLAHRPEALLGINTAFGIYVSDTSLSPKYMPGETLYVNPDRPLTQGCSAFIITKDNKTQVGQYEEWVHKNLHLRGFSPSREIIKIPVATLRVAYRIIGSIECA